MTNPHPTPTHTSTRHEARRSENTHTRARMAQQQGEQLPSSSVFATDEGEVHDIPISVITRPLMSSVDEGKVCTFVKDLEAGAEFTPIEVLWVEHPPGRHYYFSMGGCHRWEAHQRLKRDTIRARLIKVPPSTISTFMGASSPFRNLETGPQPVATNAEHAEAQPAAAVS